MGVMQFPSSPPLNLFVAVYVKERLSPSKKHSNRVMVYRVCQLKVQNLIVAILVFATIRYLEKIVRKKIVQKKLSK